MSLRFPSFLLLGLIGAFVILTVIGSNTHPSSASTFTGGTKTSSLGIRSDLYGSAWQGRELQGLFDTNSDTARFVITANTTSGERLELVADRNANTLERKHWNADGRGKSELWKGDLWARIHNAAAGDGSGFNYGTGSARLPIMTSL